ncbi:MAG: hypothetical protein HYT77_05700 [Deltaproteobacteria bacterium]|nr:hypothetical protein [Deltaproteobacteria bacterium]
MTVPKAVGASDGYYSSGHSVGSVSYRCPSSLNIPIKRERETDYKAVAIALGSLALGIGLRQLLVKRLPSEAHWFTRNIIGKAFKAKGVEGAERTINRWFHFGEEVALITFVSEWGLRRFFGYEDRVSPMGSLALMLLFQRVAVQYAGLNASGMNVMFFMDRAMDALIQVQNGKRWHEVDFTKLAMRYGTLSLFGTIRQKWGKNLLFALSSRAGHGQWIMRSANVSCGASKLQRIGWRFSPERDSVIQKLIASSNLHTEKSFVTREGCFFSPIFKKTGKALTEGEQIALAGLFGKERLADLFATHGGVIRQFAARGGKTVEALEFVVGIGLTKNRGYDITNLGIGVFVILLEGTAVFIDASTGAAFRGESFEEVAKQTFWKGVLIMPFRHGAKLRFGFDTKWAMFLDRSLKFGLEPMVNKFFPIYANAGLWRDSYGRVASKSKSLDDFLAIHVGPKIWGRGGLTRYNGNIFNLRNFREAAIPGNWGTDKEGVSPYTPLTVAYKQLAEFYATEAGQGKKGLKPEEREAIECHIRNLIDEAHNRLTTETTVRSSQYDDDTVIKQAIVVSAATYYAHLQQDEYFGRLVRENHDWFQMFERVRNSEDVAAIAEEINLHSGMLREKGELGAF